MSLFERLIPLFTRRLGARPPSRALEAELAALVETRRHALGLPSVEAYLQRLTTAPGDELSHLAPAFTNGWTWFFRDQEPVVALAERLRAMALRRPAHLWVAGCSTGEEAFGVAIACAELGLPARVLGTDVDASRLELARGGTYGALSLRRMPEALLARHFRPHGDGCMQVEPVLRERVELRVHNLLEPAPVAPVSGGWDAILCRNVLLHCTEEASATIVSRLTGALAPHGILLLGPGDRRPSQPPPRPSRVPPPTSIAPAPRSVAPAPLARAASVRPAPIDDWARAVAAIQSGAREHAIEILEALLARSPDHFAARLTTGNLWLGAHRFDRAADAYRRGEALEPRSAEPHFLWGALHRKRGAWDEAVVALRRALFLDEELWPARFLLAGAWERLGATARARHALAETLRSMERRPTIAWRSCVDEVDSIACPAEMVRAVCAQRLAGAEHEGEPRWR